MHGAARRLLIDVPRQNVRVTRWRLTSPGWVSVPAAPDVCLWHLADMLATLGDVRFRGSSGPSEVRRQCLLMTQSGHRPPNREG
jgi:hypothetical protein